MNTVKNNTIPTFNINAFVIPNSSMCYSKEHGNSPCSCGDYMSMRDFVGRCESLGRLGINPFSFERGGVEGMEITVQDHWIQLWMHNEDCDNLNDHGVPEEMMKVIGDMPNGELVSDLLPQFVPARFLEGVKEGDEKETIITKWDSDTHDHVPVAKIHWTFKQQGYRYARFGNFEDVVQRVLRVGKSYATKKENAAAAA